MGKLSQERGRGQISRSFLSEQTSPCQLVTTPLGAKLPIPSPGHSNQAPEITMAEANPYKDSLNLPQTDFPMRGNLTQNEPTRLARWDAEGLYQQIQERRKDAPSFILHDGPPFANGDVHMGTALNKLLKDLVLKSKTMAGFRCPYIPGWDCHGLPIEFKVVKEARDLTPVEIRERSEAFARNFIDVQRASFKRLGVLGDWENPYLTLEPTYEADVLRCFATFVEKDLVYQSKKPVLWSFGARTALAEAEVEYKEKVSPAIYVRFNLTADAASPGNELADASLVIWTTTPWTLPANTGIAMHPAFDYLVGTFSHESGRSERLVIAKELLENFAENTGFTLNADKPTAILKGKDFLGLSARHPFLDRSSRVINALFVTAETGTGAVHIAPGHGQDDYVAGIENGLELISPVDDAGLFTEECGLPELVGTHVFKANDSIIAMLLADAKGPLLGRNDHHHEYPHCWRSKTPIIFRSVEQFFIRIDALRETALEEIDKTRWIPAWGRNRIHGTVEARPDWCISRQRTWGVPLPVFFSPEGEVILDKDLISRVADVVEEHGTNLWYADSDEAWATRLDLPAGTRRSRDTLDVWIDSGCSHVAVLDRHPDLHAPADLYLEATDQHRGWFQSSLMISTAVRGTAPYKTVITHGFVTHNGKKVSKSDEGKGGKKVKPMTAKAFYDAYGADLVRLWAASVDYETEVPFSDELFKTQTTDAYRRIRNTLRILLGNLDGFDPTTDSVTATELTFVDTWILERLHTLTAECLAAYENFEFRKVFNALNQFLANDLSALYIDITKDRMYCDAADSPRRRATQTAIHQVLSNLCRLLAPITAFTADEAWEHMGNTGSVHLEDFPAPDPEFAPGQVSAQIESLLKVRSTIQQQIEVARKADLIGSNNEAAVTLHLQDGDLPEALLENQESLMEFLILSDLTIVRGAAETTAEVTATDHEKCPRCWRQTADVGQSHAEVCGRCAETFTG